MSKFDYNGSSFRNAAIDRLNGKFGKGPGDGLKSANANTVAGSSLANPFQQKSPLSKGLGDTSIKKPDAPKVPSAKPPVAKPAENRVPAPAPKAPAPKAPEKKTAKQVRQENRVAVTEQRGKNKVANLQQKSAMTPEQKMERKEKRRENIGKSAKGVLEGAGTALGLYGTYQGIKRANKESEGDGN